MYVYTPKYELAKRTTLQFIRITIYIHTVHIHIYIHMYMYAPTLKPCTSYALPYTYIQYIYIYTYSTYVHVRTNTFKKPIHTFDSCSRGRCLYGDGAAVLAYLHEEDLHPDAHHLVGRDAEDDEVVVPVVLPPQFLIIDAIVTPIHTYIHTYIQTNQLLERSLSFIQTQISLSFYSIANVYTHTYVHTYTTLIHTYIHTYESNLIQTNTYFIFAAINKEISGRPAMGTS